MDLEKNIIKQLKKYTKLKEICLEVPPDSKLGDFAFPCFSLSKKFKKSPQDISKELSEKIKNLEGIKEIKSFGPYLNFFIDKQKIAEEIIKDILKKKNNFGKDKNKERIMIEFISPNTNKSLHLGHLRNGVLGEAVYNLLKFKGYKVIKTSLNNDKGTGISEAMLGYQTYHDGESPDKIKPDHFVAQCYVDYKMSATDEMKKKVQDINLRWENNDKEILDLWKKLTGWVYKGYAETYKRLNISFDKEYYESKIYKEGKDIVKEGLKKKIFVNEDGAIIAKLEKYKLPNKILIKSDGTSLYMTQDLYLAKLKEKEFKIDKNIYVVANEQDTHFRQLFKILELLKFRVAKKSYHLSYGLVNLPSGRMKSREGTVVDTDDIIEEVVNVAKEEIKKRYKKLNNKEVDKRAEIIGLGALKFFMFKFDNKTNFTYDPEKSLSFEGETGPYCQYSYARICSILEKYGKKIPNKFDSERLNDKKDEEIINLLWKFKEILYRASEEYKPNLIARYVLDLCQTFNEFYHSCPILKADDETKIARLNLILAVREIISICLNLLGVDVLESM
jgi:arginyl-tRNA synthetase